MFTQFFSEAAHSISWVYSWAGACVSPISSVFRVPSKSRYRGRPELKFSMALITWFSGFPGEQPERLMKLFMFSLWWFNCSSWVSQSSWRPGAGSSSLLNRQVWNSQSWGQNESSISLPARLATVEKYSSKATWDCGMTKPVYGLSIKPIKLDFWETKKLSKAREWLTLWDFCPSCRCESKTNTGQTNTLQLWMICIGQNATFSSPFWILSLTKKYFISRWSVLLLLDIFQFSASRIVLLLSWHIVVVVKKFSCDARKCLVHRT